MGSVLASQNHGGAWVAPGILNWLERRESIYELILVERYSIEFSRSPIDKDDLLMQIILSSIGRDSSPISQMLVEKGQLCS